MWKDLYYASRALRRNPGFTIVVVLSLALGTGANTALFSLVNALVLRQLPVSEPQRLAYLEHGDTRRPLSPSFSYPRYTRLRAGQQAFEDLFAYFAMPLDVGPAGDAVRTHAAFVSGNFFRVLGTAAFAGRNINEEDDKPGSPPVLMIGYGLWQSRFGQKANIAGTQIPVQGVPATIVGVMPPQFAGLEVGQTLDVVMPAGALAQTLSAMNALRSDRVNGWRIGGRLRRGVGLAQASGMLASIWPHILAEAGRPSSDDAIRAQPGAHGFSGLRAKYARAVYLLLAIVGLVLLIACANLANLLLARANGRRREFATRLALGADRWRIARQSILETLLCTLLGTGLGVLLAYAGARALIALMSGVRGQVALDTRPDLTVLAFAAAIALGTALLAGAGPALRAARVDSGETLQGASRTRVGSRQSGLSWLAVICQVSLSFVLVAGASVFARSLNNLYSVDSGFDRAGVLIFEMDFGKTPPAPDRLAAAARSQLERVSGLPGVRAASFSSFTPMAEGNWTDRPQIEGQAVPSGREADCNLNKVTPDYFTVLGTPFVSGRAFRAEDNGPRAGVAIVNEAFARTFFPDGSPLGRRFTLSLPGLGPLEIVGVVKDTKYTSLRVAAPRQIYLPFTPVPQGPRPVTLCIRTDGGTGSEARFAPSVRQLLSAMAPEVRLTVTTLSTLVRDSLTEDRLLATVSGAFAGLALALAMVGIYGLIAYSAAARMPEIGLRVALGAQPSSIEWMMLKQACLLVAGGIAAGVVAVLAAAPAVASLVFGLKPAEPWSLAANSALLAAVALLAAYLPARRASRGDPMAALRHD
ncbi:MAG TPA: ABC transporter permease [Bryobacteraceae bacterium]